MGFGIPTVFFALCGLHCPGTFSSCLDLLYERLFGFIFRFPKFSLLHYVCTEIHSFIHLPIIIFKQIVFSSVFIYSLFLPIQQYLPCFVKILICLNEALDFKLFYMAYVATPAPLWCSFLLVNCFYWLFDYCIHFHVVLNLFVQHFRVSQYRKQSIKKLVF